MRVSQQSVTNTQKRFFSPIARIVLFALILPLFDTALFPTSTWSSDADRAADSQTSVPKTPNDLFILIPANPTFRFAVSLNNRNGGEKAPILSAYYLAKYPVTNEEYQTFLQETNAVRYPKYWVNGDYPSGKSKHPVLDVSYEDALSYCRWLETKYSGWSFRLPTEAEWENAAAGPEHFVFPWGNNDENRMEGDQLITRFNYNAVVSFHFLRIDPDRLVEFCHERSPRKGERVRLSEVLSVRPGGAIQGWIDHRTYTGFVYTDLFRELSSEGGFTTPVDQYPQGKSEYGCYDMAGNSWDWTSSNITATNGAEKGKTVKAIRGGSWYANKNSCRTGYRGEGRRAQGAFNTVGFRVAANSQ